MRIFFYQDLISHLITTLTTALTFTKNTSFKTYIVYHLEKCINQENILLII